ncbi:MAG: hypothetical protein ACP5G0_14185 [Desulfomonilia bacterium]
MRHVINATQAVRSFSEILNEIKYKGATYTIERSGKAIAELSPVSSPLKKRVLSELLIMLKNLPKLGNDAVVFTEDIGDIKKTQPGAPKSDTWG